jgi:outer membrane biosynthesis protein TonB
MIPRILVPTVVRPVGPAAEGETRARRGSTLLDSRQLVPRDLPRVELDTRSNIPSHVPLEVLGKRLIVPRDMPATPLQTRSNLPTHLPLKVLDSRVVVPKGARAPEIVERKPLPVFSSEVLPQDIFTTGEVQLLAPVEEETTGWHLAENWVAKSGSILAHALLIVLVLLQPRLFPFQPHSEEQNELASRNLGITYVPATPLEPVPVVPAPPPQPRERIHIDPRLFQRTNPEMEVPKELTPLPPRPERAERATPEPGSGTDPQQPRFITPPARVEPPQRAQMEPPKSDPSSAPFQLPGSPGRSLEDSLRSAAKGRSSGGPTGLSFGGRIPGGPLGSGSSGGQAYGNIELLTPTEGVDFSNYLARVLASVRRNWYAVIPESARLGERGKVVLQFRIMRDGSVPPGEPQLMRTSGRQPLDFAAMSSIRTSNPFEPLPAQFSGPFIELRFIYLYNLPLDTP